MASDAKTVLVVGATGNIGTNIIKLLGEKPNTKVLQAGRTGAVKLDIYDIDSVKSLDEQIPDGVDHVVVCCGASTFGPLSGFDSAKWADNCTNKLISVSRLAVMLANGKEVKCLKEGGSITVTCGQASRTINKMWPGIAVNNAGLEAFVKNAGIDLPRGIRLNAVSPALVYETAVKAGLPLTNTVPAAECAACYIPLIFADASVTGTVVDAGSQTAFTKSHHGGQKDGITPVAETAPAGYPAAESATPAEKRSVEGKDFRGEASTYERTPEAGVIGLLAYDICDGVSEEEYDKWLYGEHYHDLLANPELQKINLRTVCPNKKARLSSGDSVTNQFEFQRIAELHFASHEAYSRYIEWFQAKGGIPAPRTPAGRSAFKFYLLSESEAITKAAL